MGEKREIELGMILITSFEPRGNEEFEVGLLRHKRDFCNELEDTSKILALENGGGRFESNGKDRTSSSPIYTFI